MRELMLDPFDPVSQDLIEHGAGHCAAISWGTQPQLSLVAHYIYTAVKTLDFAGNALDQLDIVLASNRGHFAGRRSQS
jgi:hypothetical protein